LKGRDQLTKVSGPNPFDNLGLEISADGTMAKPTEWLNGKWVSTGGLYLRRRLGITFWVSDTPIP
jgi:hypothetical protein